MAGGDRFAHPVFGRAGAGLGGGPGLGTDDKGAAALWFALETDLPVIVDADGLTILAAHPELLVDRAAPTVLTPHAGEFARLAGAPPGDDRVGACRKLADTFGATVLLKGNVTVIADPGGPVYLNPAGQSWAATAGSGDVLSGMIGALLASGLPPPRRPRPRRSCMRGRRRCRRPTRVLARRRRRRHGSCTTSGRPGNSIAAL